MIEFICDFDIVAATGVNLSESGICFDVDESLAFEMQFVLDGESCRHRADLLRMEMLPVGVVAMHIDVISIQTQPPELSSLSSLSPEDSPGAASSRAANGCRNGATVGAPYHQCSTGVRVWAAQLSGNAHWSRWRSRSPRASGSPLGG